MDIFEPTQSYAPGSFAAMLYGQTPPPVDTTAAAAAMVPSTSGLDFGRMASILGKFAQPQQSGMPSIGASPIHGLKGFTPTDKKQVSLIDPMIYTSLAKILQGGK